MLTGVPGVTLLGVALPATELAQRGKRVDNGERIACDAVSAAAAGPRGCGACSVSSHPGVETGMAAGSGCRRHALLVPRCTQSSGAASEIVGIRH